MSELSDESNKKIRQEIAAHLREIRRLNRLFHPRPKLVCVDCGVILPDQAATRLNFKYGNAQRKLRCRQCWLKHIKKQ